MMRTAWWAPVAALGTAIAVALIAVTVSTMGGGDDPAPRSLVSTPTPTPSASTTTPPATTTPESAPAPAPTAIETAVETPAEATSEEPAPPVETATENRTEPAAPAPAQPTYSRCDPGFLKLGPGGFSGFGSGGPDRPEISGSFEAHIRAMDGFPELCPDASVPVFWATYGADASGVSRLYASGVVWLTTANQTVSLPVIAPRVCRQSWFIGNGDQIVPSFAQGEVPYEGRRILWNPPVFNDGCLDH